MENVFTEQIDDYGNVVIVSVVDNHDHVNAHPPLPEISEEEWLKKRNAAIEAALND